LGDPTPSLSARRILALWWPLATSWILMGVELPLFTACVARMAEPKENLAAYGSIVFPLALVIEAPIMMLLAAATALAADQESWGRVRRFMHKASACLTALHALVAFTPLFDLLAERVFEVPAATVEPARLGLRIMLPWTWSIAYRRAHQGVLIRHERGRAVVVGSLVRIGANLAVYASGFAAEAAGRPLPGIAVGASAVIAGVVSEATFIGWCTRALLRGKPLPPRGDGPELTRLGFLRFYVPLALTQLIALLVPPIGSATMGRMREPLESLAAWPGVHGLLFLARAGCFAFTEVAVSQLREAGSARALRRFASGLGLVASAALALVAWTPLAGLWFGRVSGLAPELERVAISATALAIAWPLLQALQSWYQGQLVHERRTRHVTEAMLLYFLVTAVLLDFGASRIDWNGLRYVVVALTLSGVVQTAWLAWSARRRI
jgi:hypothetical protein